MFYNNNNNKAGVGIKTLNPQSQIVFLNKLSGLAEGCDVTTIQSCGGLFLLRLVRADQSEHTGLCRRGP